MPFSSIIDDGDIVTEFVANPGGAAAKAAETDDRYPLPCGFLAVRAEHQEPFPITAETHVPPPDQLISLLVRG